MADKYEVVYPRSYNDASLEPFEYLLCWYGRDGAFYQFMFYDIQLRTRVRNNVVNEEDVSKMTAIIQRETREATIYAEDLSLNDLNVLTELFANKYIIRLSKDGTTERMVPDRSSVKQKNYEGRYDLQFKIILSNLPHWR